MLMLHAHTHTSTQCTHTLHTHTVACNSVIADSHFILSSFIYSWVRSLYPNGSAALSRFRMVGTPKYLSDIKDLYLQRMGPENLPKRRRMKGSVEARTSAAAAAAASSAPIISTDTYGAACAELTPEEEHRLQLETADAKDRLDKLEGTVDEIAAMLKNYINSTVGASTPDPFADLFFNVPVGSS